MALKSQTGRPGQQIQPIATSLSKSEFNRIMDAFRKARINPSEFMRKALKEKADELEIKDKEAKKEKAKKEEKVEKIDEPRPN